MQSPRQRPGVLANDNVGGSGSWAGMNGNSLRMVGSSSRSNEENNSAVGGSDVDDGERKQSDDFSS